MKRNIFGVLVTAIMILGMTLTAFAENFEGFVFDADYCFEIDGNGGYSYDENVSVIVSSDTISGEYTTDHGDVISWSARNPYAGEDNIYGFGKNIHFRNGEVRINGLLIYEGEGATMGFTPYGNRSFEFSVGSDSYNGNSCYFSIGGDLAAN